MRELCIWNLNSIQSGLIRITILISAFAILSCHDHRSESVMSFKSVKTEESSLLVEPIKSAISVLPAEPIAAKEPAKTVESVAPTKFVESAGYYLFSGQIFYVNNNGYACVFRSWDEFIFSGGGIASPYQTVSAFSSVIINGPCYPNDRPALQQIINSTIDAGKAATINLEPRTYRLVCAENKPQKYCLTVSGAKNLTIKGTEGKTKLIISSPRSGAILIQNSTNFKLDGVAIDYETPPFSQGRIITYDSKSITYKADIGYPEPSDSIFSEDLFGSIGSARVGFVFTGQSKITAGPRSSYLGLTPGQGADAMPIRVGDRAWKIPVSIFNSTISLGDGFAMGPRSSYGLYFIRNTGIQLSNVSIYTAPSIGVVFVGNRGNIVVDSIKVELPAGSNRLLSTVSDALHAQNNASQIKVNLSHFSGMGDDAFNTYSVGLKIISFAANQIILNQPFLDFVVGDRIQILDSKKEVSRLGNGGEAVITAISNEGSGQIRVFLDRTVAALIKSGDMAYNVNQAAPGTILSNNVFGYFRGGIRLRSVGAQVINNTFADSRNAHVLVSTEEAWNEGPMVNVPYNAGNGLVTYHGHNDINIGFNPMTSLILSPLVDLNLSNSSQLSSYVFNSSVYKELNPDLNSMDPQQLQSHWINNGVSEGRAASKSFHSVNYLNKYSDLSQAFGKRGFKKGIEHFVQFGFQEGR